MGDKFTMTLDFDGGQNRELQEFFRQQMQDFDKKKQETEERMRQLFERCISFDSEPDEKTIAHIYNIFAIGYALGWNDCVKAQEEEK